MKAEIVTGTTTPVTKKIRKMEPGDIGTFTYGGRQVLALRIYDGVVNLHKPTETWDCDATWDVVPLPKGTQITLTVE